MPAWTSARVELGLVAVAGAGLLVNWLARQKGDEAYRTRTAVLKALKKTGLTDPKISVGVASNVLEQQAMMLIERSMKVTEGLIEEFFRLTKDMPLQPHDDIFWTVMFPLYQIRCYFCERKAFKTVVNKAAKHVRTESN